MNEPPRQNSLDLLEPYVQERVERIFAQMQAKGFDPIAYETLRSPERQRWLFGVGRTHDLGRKPVTWTLHSHHLPDTNGLSKAADVISKSRAWDWPEFFEALHGLARAEGMHDCAGGLTWRLEGCHIQWG